MDVILRMNTIQSYAEYFGMKTLHPLVTTAVFSGQAFRYVRKRLDFYTIVLKESLGCGALHYGLGRYDYQEGTVVCTGPGQVIGADDDGQLHTIKGWGLYFHPDFLRGTPLARTIRQYGFFDYATNEALHLSVRERDRFKACLADIHDELMQGVDRHTKPIVVAHIELLLTILTRFYDRQFVTRELQNRDLLARLERFLNDWFTSDRPQTEGLPSVAQCAKALSLSSNYFGDLIRRKTGLSAQEHIHRVILDKAKELLSDSSNSIAEVAYALGFKYPQHFSRLFRKIEGVSPADYRRKA